MLDDGHSLDDIEVRNDELREQLAAQQLRTFSRWWNAVLARLTVGIPPQVRDLCDDVRSGELALMLLAELSGTLVHVLHLRPQTRFQMLENQNHFLTLLKQKGLRFVNIGAEDLVDGNRTSVLGLTWTLILRFEIQRYGADELELMRWVKESTKNYCGVEVSSWGQSFSNGLVFTALIQEYAPEVCGSQFESHELAKPFAMLRSAFSLAETHLGVPRLLDEEELARGVADERSVITYVAKLRQSCVARSLERQRREAAQAEAVRVTKHESLRSEMQCLAAKLQLEAARLDTWIIEQEARFMEAVAAHNDFSSGDEVSEVAVGAAEGRRGGATLLGTMVQREERQRALVAELVALREDFRTREKPVRASEKMALCKLIGDVLSRQQAKALSAPVLKLREVERGVTVIGTKTELAESAPRILQLHWLRMEAAEREYESTISKNLVDVETAMSKHAAEAKLAVLKTSLREQAARAGVKTMDLEVTAWAAEYDQEADSESEGGHGNIGSTAWVKVHGAALAPWLDEEAAREEERAQLRRQYDDAIRYCEHERRQPPHEDWHAREHVWEDIKKYSTQLQVTLNYHQIEAQRCAARVEAKMLGAPCKHEAHAWLAHVNEVMIEAKPCEMEANHRVTRLLSRCWQPPWGTLGELCIAMGSTDHARAEALLFTLDAQVGAEKEQLLGNERRKQALGLLAEVLPRLVIRRQRLREAAAEVRTACTEVEMLRTWAAARRKALLEMLSTLEQTRPATTEATVAVEVATLASPSVTAAAAAGNTPLPNARDELLGLIEFARGEKAQRGAKRLTLNSRLCRATASYQLQRAPVAVEVDASAALAALDATWEAMECSEVALAQALHEQECRLEGGRLLWERLHRGCKRLHEWMCDSQAVRECTELPASEAEALHLLREAELVADETCLHAHTLQTCLIPLAHRLVDAELSGPAAAELAQVAAIGKMTGLMAARVALLERELERQRRRARIKRTYASALFALEQSIELARELCIFPIETVDTAESIAAVLEGGFSKLASLLALEGPETSDTMRSHVEALFAEWHELAEALQQREADWERAKPHLVHAAALQKQYKSAAAAFMLWYARGNAMLRLRPAVAAAPADVQCVVNMVRAHLIEGDAHLRVASEVVYKLDELPDKSALGAATVNELAPLTIGLAVMQEALIRIRELTAAMESTVNLAPPIFEAPQLIAAALSDLAAAVESPEPLSAALLEAALLPAQVRFVVDEISTVPAASVAYTEPIVLDPQVFDPFPTDRVPMMQLRLLTTPLAPSSHAFAVIEWINKARMQPARRSEALAAELCGCFDGTSFLTPHAWGGRRLRTVEGQTAVHSLCEALREAKAVPTLQLVPALCESAQQLADELAAGSGSSPLIERLMARGTYSGSAGEAVVYGVGPPEAVATQLLISDGDALRRNRRFLLDGRLRVAGCGFAAHPKHGTVCVVTLVSLFATPLAESKTLECQGNVVSNDFARVLEALPSEQARAIATNALLAGKRVRLEYQPGAVRIGVFEGDNSSCYSSLRWS